MKRRAVGVPTPAEKACGFEAASATIEFVHDG